MHDSGLTPEYHAYVDRLRWRTLIGEARWLTRTILDTSKPKMQLIEVDPLESRGSLPVIMALGGIVHLPNCPHWAIVASKNLGILDTLGIWYQKVPLD
jgi:hypothetical protein